MFRSLTILLATLFIALPIHSQQDITLNGEWQMTIGGKSYTVKVPHTYNVMSGLEDYAGTAVYTRSLPITSDLKGRNIRICFDAVYHDAIVYVNGKKVGEHIGKGYTPFSFDITKAVDFSGKNNVKVITSNAYSDKMLPYKRSFDWCNDGGIYRDVRLHVSGNQTLRYVHVTPTIDGKVKFGIRLFNDKDKKVNGHLDITNRQTGEIVYRGNVSLKKSREDKELTKTITLSNVQLWDFDHPNLYDFTFTIPGSDSMKDHFGFREFKIVDHNFVLNGERVRLPGIETMAGSNPEFGAAEPKDFIDKTVSTMKDLNTTITRFHWQQDDRYLDDMDEMGILATEQIPWWQQPMGKLGDIRQNAVEQLKEMIEAHYNHPCIFAWGLSNEVWNNNEDLKYLSKISRKEDPSRLVMSFSNHTFETLADDPSLLLDIPTYNEYTGTWHGKSREELPQRLNNIHKILNGRPLFITEAGLCEPAFTGGDARRIDDMFYHIGQWQKTDFISGYIYFCLQDYRTQMGEEGWGKYRIRRHGITKVDLTPKASYSVLKQIMSPIEIIKVLPANSKQVKNSLAGQVEIKATDHDAYIVLHVKNNIPSYTLRGYKLNYKDAKGNNKTIALPDMEPGKSYPLTLRNINANYAFVVCRPNGFTVTEY